MLEVYWRSNSSMAEVENSSVQLCLMSPHSPSSFDNATLNDYYLSIENVLKECYQKLKDKGFLVFCNTDNYRESSLKLRHIEFCKIIEAIGFNIFSIKIWSRGKIIDFFRPTFSYLIFASKNKHKSKEIAERMHKPPFVYDVWEIEGDRNMWKKYDVFPKELVSRCIQVFTEEGDTVLDPYAGSGTTILVAESMNRNGVGYEINPELKEVFQQGKLRFNQKNLFDFS